MKKYNKPKAVSIKANNNVFLMSKGQKNNKIVKLKKLNKNSPLK